MNIRPFMKFPDRKQPVLPVRRARGKWAMAITSFKPPPLLGQQSDQDQEVDDAYNLG